MRLNEGRYKSSLLDDKRRNAKVVFVEHRIIVRDHIGRFYAIAEYWYRTEIYPPYWGSCENENSKSIVSTSVDYMRDVLSV